MRGKVLLILVSVCELGITPAYAGKSSRYVLVVVCQRDHPRVCGEKHSWLSAGVAV